MQAHDSFNDSLLLRHCLPYARRDLTYKLSARSNSAGADKWLDPRVFSTTAGCIKALKAAGGEGRMSMEVHGARGGANGELGHPQCSLISSSQHTSCLTLHFTPICTLPDTCTLDLPPTCHTSTPMRAGLQIVVCHLSKASVSIQVSRGRD